MPIRCPICQTSDLEIPPTVCKICSWSLLSESSTEALCDSQNIDWAKQIWLHNQHQKEQIGDYQSHIDLLKRRLERLTNEKDATVASIRHETSGRLDKLGTEVVQLQQNLQTTETTNQQLQSNLQGQLGDRQKQIELLEQELQQTILEKDQTQEIVRNLEAEVVQLKHSLENSAQTSQKLLGDYQIQIQSLQEQLQQSIIEKEQAQEVVRQLEEKHIPQLESKVDKLQRRLQNIETTNTQLENSLQKQQIDYNQQQKLLESQLTATREQVNDVTKYQKMAQIALSRWLQLDLLDRFVTDIENIATLGNALNDIKKLQQEHLNQKWQDFPAHSHILQLVIDFLEHKQELKEKLQLLSDSYQVVVFVDAILTIRDELKYNLTM